MYALARVAGYEVALREAEKLPLRDNHFYHLLLSELLSGTDPEGALQALRTARELCGTATERDFITGRIVELERARTV